MKIVHINYSLAAGGAETLLIDIVNEQAKTQNVSIIIINKYYDNELFKGIDNKVKLYLLNRKPGSKNVFKILNLWRLLIKLRPDVIHCHNHTLVQMIAFRKKCVLTVHDVNIPDNNFRYYKKVFAISNAVKSDIEGRSNIKPVLVYNGIKVDEVKHKENYDFDKFRIVQVSRLDHLKKGQHIIIETLKILVNKKGFKNICVDFIGEGKSLDYLKRLVKEYQLKEFVNLLGIRGRDYIYEHLRDYSLLIQPSLYEGFGLTIVEAMAAKVPVLVSNIDGPLEVIENGEYGWFYKSEDSTDCADSIIKIIKNYRSNETINKINNAFIYTVRRFDIKETSANYLKYY